jgi:hypothetical protein
LRAKTKTIPIIVHLCQLPWVLIILPVNVPVFTIFSKGNEMLELNVEEVVLVSGGDAAATRQPGQNSWGEYSSNPLRDIIFWTSRFY